MSSIFDEHSRLETDSIAIAYYDLGKKEDKPVIVLHGYPYAPSAYIEVAPYLLEHSFRVIVPYLRGYGPSIYRDEDSIRTGQQAALGSDLINLIEGLGLEPAIVAGYDWGGRAACVASLVRPDLIAGLISAQGYNIVNPTVGNEPSVPEDEYMYWYQWYFQTERGRNGLRQYRAEIGNLLWKLWSPNWEFTQEQYDNAAKAFDNPDFVDTVISSYRHRYGNFAGDPRYEPIEKFLLTCPPITVPTITILGDCDAVHPSYRGIRTELFTHLIHDIVISDCGHNIPQEKPKIFADLIIELARHLH